MKHAVVRPSLGQGLIAHGLAAVWCLLIAFAIISIRNPPWLQALSQPGIYSEARGFKDRGDDALQRGDYGTAIASYARSLQIRPEQTGVSVNLAVAYGRTGDAPRAIELLERTLTSAGQRAGVVHYNLGELLEGQGRLTDALAQYEQAIGYDVPQELVYRKLGGLHLRLGHLEAAYGAFERSLACQLDVRLPVLYALSRASVDEQAAPADRAAAAELLARGVSEDDLGRYDLAIIRAAQARDPEIAKTHNHLGVICARLGDHAAAREHFERSLAVWPGNPDAERALRMLRDPTFAGGR